MSPDEQPVQPEAAETSNDADINILMTSSLDDISPEPPNEDEELAEQEEAPAPSTIHPSAAAGTTIDDEDLVNGREKHGEYFIGYWYDKPNFGCPYCPFSTVETGGNGLTELHVLAMIEAGNMAHMAALQLKGE